MTLQQIDPPDVFDQEHFPALGEVASHTPAVTPQTIVRTVADEFFQNAAVDAVAVVENDVPVGLVTRTKFLATVFRQFGWELFGPPDNVDLQRRLHAKPGGNAVQR